MEENKNRLEKDDDGKKEMSEQDDIETFWGPALLRLQGQLIRLQDQFIKTDDNLLDLQKRVMELEDEARKK